MSVLPLCHYGPLVADVMHTTYLTVKSESKPFVCLDMYMSCVALDWYMGGC